MDIDLRVNDVIIMFYHCIWVHWDQTPHFYTHMHTHKHGHTHTQNSHKQSQEESQVCETKRFTAAAFHSLE